MIKEALQSNRENDGQFDIAMAFEYLMRKILSMSLQPIILKIHYRITSSKYEKKNFKRSYRELSFRTGKNFLKQNTKMEGINKKLINLTILRKRKTV